MSKPKPLGRVDVQEATPEQVAAFFERAAKGDGGVVMSEGLAELVRAQMGRGSRDLQQRAGGIEPPPFVPNR
jgi:hypothetical protein